MSDMNALGAESMNATDRLRQAARAIRETVRDATPGSWQVGRSWAGDLTVMGDIGQPIAVVASDHVAALDRNTQADAALIALMASPPVALAVADWLEKLALDIGGCPIALPGDAEATKLADLILVDGQCKVVDGNA